MPVKMTCAGTPPTVTVGVNTALEKLPTGGIVAGGNRGTDPAESGREDDKGCRIVDLGSVSGQPHDRSSSPGELINPDCHTRLRGCWCRRAHRHNRRRCGASRSQLSRDRRRSRTAVSDDHLGRGTRYRPWHLSVDLPSAHEGQGGGGMPLKVTVVLPSLVGDRNAAGHRLGVGQVRPKQRD